MRIVCPVRAGAPVPSITFALVSAVTGPPMAMNSWNGCAPIGSTPINRAAVHINEVATAFISVSFDVDNEFHTGL